jgi:hypothetical protein
LFDHVRKAKLGITCTHFTKEPPSQAYLALLQELLNNSITIRRLVCFSGDPRGKDYDWMSGFEGNPHYEQIVVNVALPFNVVVIDQRIVWLFLPARNSPHFRNAIWFDDKDVAELLELMVAQVERLYRIEGHARNFESTDSAIVD